MAALGNLQDLVNQLYSEILFHPNHELTPNQRLQVYEAINQMAGEYRSKVRGRLELITAQKISSCWEKVWFNNTMMRDMLKTAELMLQGALDPDVACLKANHERLRLEQICTGEFTLDESSACSAGEAVIEAVFTIGGVDPFDGVVVDDKVTDDDLDPWCSDTARWALRAYIKSFPDSDGYQARKLEFWEWWLHHAIPRAWEMEYKP